MPKYLKYILQSSIIIFVLVASFIFYKVYLVGDTNTSLKPSTINKGVSSSTPNPIPVSTPSDTAPSATATPTITATPTAVDHFAELPNHNKQSDCWIQYKTHIYDITSYFGSHPGGDKRLLKYCGKDATVAFETMDKGSPQNHSKAAYKLLDQYLIY